MSVRNRSWFCNELLRKVLTMVSLHDLPEFCYGRMIIHFSLSEILNFRRVNLKIFSYINSLFARLDLRRAALKRIPTLTLDQASIAGRFTHLKELQIDGSWIDGTSFFACRFPQMLKFSIQHAHYMNDQILAMILTTMPALEHFYVQDGNYITDTLLAYIGQCFRNLVGIKFERCPEITSVGVKAMLDGVSDSLEVLSLAGSRRVSDSAFTDIALDCPNITFLSLAFCSVGDQSLMTITDLEDLHSLDVCYTRCNDWGMKMMKSIPDMRMLQMAGTRISGDEFNKMPETITRLNLAGCINIKMKLLRKLAKRLPDLTYLNLSDTPLTDEGILYLQEGLFGLTDLVLHRCDQLTDEAFEFTVDAWPDLENCDLSGCYGITEDIFDYMPLNCEVIVDE